MHASISFVCEVCTCAVLVYVVLGVYTSSVNTSTDIKFDITLCY